MSLSESSIPDVRPTEPSLFDYAWPIVIICIYLTAQLVANVASLKIGLVAGWAVDMGTFIYPITFTLRDMVHKTLGKKAARVLILATGGANLFMALYLFLVALVPEEPSWGLGAAFSAVLSPMWRIVLASIAAQVISELVNTEVYSWFALKVTRKMKWLRVLVSNAAGIPVDNAVFAFGAFAFTLPLAALWEIFTVNFMLKFGITLVSLPLIYIGKERATID